MLSNIIRGNGTPSSRSALVAHFAHKRQYYSFSDRASHAARFYGKLSIFLRMTDKAGRRVPSNLSLFLYFFGFFLLVRLQRYRADIKTDKRNDTVLEFESKTVYFSEPSFCIIRFSR